MGNSKENDDCRSAHWSVLASKREVPCLSVDAKSSDRVTPLIAREKEISGGINTKAARIITPSPLFPGKCQRASFSNGKEGDAVMQPVGRINEFPVR